MDIVAPGLTIRTKLIDGTFPDVDRVMPKADTFRVTLPLDKAEILTAISRVNIFSVSWANAIKFARNEAGRVEISAHAPSYGTASTVVSTKWPESELDEFGVNSAYLTQLLSGCLGSDHLQPFPPQRSDRDHRRRCGHDPPSHADAGTRR